MNGTHSVYYMLEPQRINNAYTVNAQIFNKNRLNLLKIMNFRSHKPQINIYDKISTLTMG